MTDLGIDISSCEREAIHIPGAIQPHGVLLALSEPDLVIVQASENTAKHLAFDAPLGLTVRVVLGEATHRALANIPSDKDLTGQPFYLGRFLCNDRAPCDVIVHRFDGLLFLELEPVHESEPAGFEAIYEVVRTFVTQLQRASSVDELSQLAATELRRVTGFGRALVYRFDEEGHGQVLAEDIAQGYDSYLHHRFPASDLPKQARDLYRLNPVRLIARADYTPSPLTPPHNPFTQKPTDLSFAVLRSVSPLHLEYMRNMGTQAAMSVSIVVRGELWGLISCHHHEPRRVPYVVRAACAHLGQVLSLQIEAKEQYRETAYRLELRRLLVSLLAEMADADGSLVNLGATPRELLRFGDATGAAIVHDERCNLIGHTPSAADVIALAQWLGQQSRNVFASDRLPEVFEPASRYADRACGVLALSISQVHRHFIIWFRPEIRQTVQWAGDPNKPMHADGAGGLQLHPRTSFATWKEEVAGRSRPWRSSELSTAEELRSALVAIVLKSAEEMAGMASELRRINKELEAFSYSVSHDLRAPLRHIAGYADLLSDYEHAAMSERGQRFLGNIKSAAKFAGTLVDDLLTFSQMGRASLKISRLNLDEMVRGLIRATSMDLGQRNIEWKVESLPTVEADPVFMQAALQNLLSNAVKYTAGRDPARIRFTSEETEDSYWIRVADNGVGFNMKYAGKLFGVFQRLHKIEDFEGTGIGLASVKRIVERHGGAVQAEGEVGKGAIFSICLPKRRSAVER